MCENYFLRWTAWFLMKKQPAPEGNVSELRSSSVRCQPHVNSVHTPWLCTCSFVFSFFANNLEWGGWTAQSVQWQGCGLNDRVVGVRFRVTDCSLLYSFQTVSEVHPSSCAVGIRDSVPGAWRCTCISLYGFMACVVWKHSDIAFLLRNVTA
jgi:hypothetical protein